MKFRTLTCITAMTLFATLGLSRSAQAQTFTLLNSFDGTDGYNPSVALVQASNGNLYGTTETGGASGSCGPEASCGNVFELTPNGTLTLLFSFDETDGSDPLAALIQTADGNLYGTTAEGGDDGTVFKITPSGTLTTLQSFDGTDGSGPEAALVQAADGNFYGTTEGGGANNDGTVFRIIPGGTLTALHSFDGTDGQYPETALVLATDGNFYGTTLEGGSNGTGTVFEITPGGTLTTLHSFDGTEGFPSGLIQAIDGNFYGILAEGGANDDGIVFKITPSGTLTTLYSFCSQSDCTDGSEPFAGLVQATDGNFYGTTVGGGANGDGTIFKITPSGALTTLHSFDGTDGQQPFGGLVQDTNGKFYGTASDGGANGDGTVYSLSVGLRPFVETQPASGEVGALVEILGSDLTGATSVTFNGTAATFTVESRSVIGATVPEGATSGTVEVTIPSGTLKSNVPFRVQP